MIYLLEEDQRGREDQKGSEVFSEDLVGQRRASVKFNPPICEEPALPIRPARPSTITASHPNDMHVSKRAKRVPKKIT